MSPPEAPTPVPTNPPWVRWAVVGMILLVWVSVGISILMGEPWGEAIVPAIAATLCLSAVDIGIDLSRRRGRKP